MTLAMLVPEDIRDIHAPVTFAPWWRWPLAIAVAALAAGAVVFAVRAWRRRRSRALTPLERARMSLRAAEAHAREGRPREWAELVAETLRAALSARLGTEVLPETTRELAPRLWARWTYEEPDAKSPTIDVGRVLGILETCDLARFARASVDADALLAATDDARLLVTALYAPEAPSSRARREREPRLVSS